MEYRLLPIRQLDTGQRKTLAVLHQSVMETLLSDLGFPIVERYYQVAVEDEQVIGFCAMKDDTVLGWVVGSPYPQVLNGRLRSPFHWFVWQMVRMLISRPQLISQLVASVRSAGEEFVPGPGEIELTYVGVAPEARGQKLGDTLIKKFLEASRTDGYQKVSLSVETDNPAALNLYQQNGFNILNTFTEGSYERHRMELILEPAR